MDVEQFLDQPKLGYFINNEFFTDSDRPETSLLSPVSNKPWKTLLTANYEDVQAAIHAAHQGYLSWKEISSPVRATYLRKLGDLMIQYSPEFAKVMAIETGKPIKQGQGEVAYAAGYFHWFAGEAERIYGQTIPSQKKDKRLMLSYEPIGVCASITPWNFPLAMAARKIAAALAAGCTMINKPSPESPVTMLLFAQLCKMAEFPPGVVNILPGPEQEIGQAFLESKVIRKLSFTGSTTVGKYLYAKSAPTLKKLTLELGGNAPLIVFDDADIEDAVSQTIIAKFRNNGQTCVAPNRVFVQESIYEDYAARLIEEVKKLRIGDPFEETTDLSTILHPSSAERVQKHIEDAVNLGAIPEYIGGNDPYNPCILIDAGPKMLIYQEETFGPVVPLFKFKDDEEGIAMANDTDFGLASYLFTKNLNRAMRAVEALEYGIVGLNDGLLSTPQASFGGIKYSGFGREGGPTALREYLTEKFISIRVM